MFVFIYCSLYMYMYFILIFYMENRDFICYGKNMGVWFSGILSGVIIINLNNSFSNSGIILINRNVIRMYLDVYKNILERFIKDKYI